MHLLVANVVSGKFG